MRYGNLVTQIHSDLSGTRNDGVRNNPLPLTMSGPSVKDHIAIGKETFVVLAISDDDMLVRSIFDEKRMLHITKEGFNELKSISLINPIKRNFAPKSISILNTQLRDKEKRMRAYCEKLDKEPFPCAKGVRERVIQNVATEIGDPHPISPSTISKWHAIWRHDRSMIDYLYRCTKARKGARLNGEVEQLITKCIDEFYAKKNMPSKKLAYKKLVAQFASNGMAEMTPSESTFRRRIERHDHIKIIKGRKGRDAARAEKRTDIKPIEARYPCDIVHADGFHVQARIECEGGYIAESAIIIVILDVFSRAVMGWSVSFGNKDLTASETSALVMQAFIHAVIPKGNADFPMFGAFREVVYDNGSAFISDETTNLLHAISASSSPHSTKSPWKKGIVERFGLTLRSSFLCDVSSYMGKRSSGSTLSNKDYPTVTKAKFMERLAEFFIYDYNRSPHEGLKGLSPILKWHEGLHDACFEPVCPMAPESLMLFRGIRTTRLPSDRSTITLNNQHFNSYELSEVISSSRLHFTKPRSKFSIEILYNPFDASAITVIHPETGELIDVPNREDVAPMTSFDELNHARSENHKAAVAGAKRSRNQGLIRREAKRSVLCSETFPDDEGDVDGRPSYYEEQIFARANNGFTDEE